MPYLIAKTDAIEKALYLRQWGVPFSVLVYVFGHDAMFWYRAWLRLGRPNLVGSTVKQEENMPEHLLADEQPHGGELGVPSDDCRYELDDRAPVTDRLAAVHRGAPDYRLI